MERVYIYTMLIYTCNIYLNKQHFIVFVYFNNNSNIIKWPNIIFKLSCHGPRISSSGMCNRFFFNQSYWFCTLCSANPQARRLAIFLSFCQLCTAGTSFPPYDDSRTHISCISNFGIRCIWAWCYILRHVCYMFYRVLYYSMDQKKYNSSTCCTVIVWICDIIINQWYTVIWEMQYNRKYIIII